jgi:hypothetical protein
VGDIIKLNRYSPYSCILFGLKMKKRFPVFLVLIKDNIIVTDSIVNIIPIDKIIGMVKDSENNILSPTKNNIAANPCFK